LRARPTSLASAGAQSQCAATAWLRSDSTGIRRTKAARIQLDYADKREPAGERHVAQDLVATLDPLTGKTWQQERGGYRCSRRWRS
jgi:hypothetical protein